MRILHYLVQPSDREEFYEYIHMHKYKDMHFTKEYMISSNFPFGVDIKRKKITVIESATVCACAAQNNQIISFEEFKEHIKSKK